MADMEVRMANVERILERIETKLDNVIGTVSDHEGRLRCIEDKGGKRWDTLVGQVIGLITAGVAGAIIGKFIK